MKVVLELGERRVTDMLTRVRSEGLFACFPLIFSPLHFNFSFSGRLPAFCPSQSSGYGLFISLFTCPSALGRINRKFSVPYPSRGTSGGWLCQSAFASCSPKQKAFHKGGGSSLCTRAFHVSLFHPVDEMTPSSSFRISPSLYSCI